MDVTEVDTAEPKTPNRFTLTTLPLPEEIELTVRGGYQVIKNLQKKAIVIGEIAALMLQSPAFKSGSRDGPIRPYLVFGCHVARPDPVGDFWHKLERQAGRRKLGFVPANFATELLLYNEDIRPRQVYMPMKPIVIGGEPYIFTIQGRCIEPETHSLRAKTELILDAEPLVPQPALLDNYLESLSLYLFHERRG